MAVLGHGRCGRQLGLAEASRGLCLLVSMVTMLYCSGLDLRGQVSREYDLKAAFLFNFAQFVDWPAEAFPDDQTPFTIGILGRDPFRNALTDVTRNENVRGRKVIILHYSRPEEIRVCHILLIEQANTGELSKILTVLKNRPILTVSEVDSFARLGGMIRMYTENAKVRLRINNEAARAAGLVISTKLLRLAEVITPESRE